MQINENKLIGEQFYTKLNLCAGEYKSAYKSLAGAVYYVAKNETDKYLLYGFTDAAGDTLFNIYATDEVFRCVVASVDSTLIGSQGITKGGDRIERIGSGQGILTTSIMNVLGYDLKLAFMSAADAIDALRVVLFCRRKLFV